MAKMVTVHSRRASGFLASTTPHDRPDYTKLYRELRSHPSSPELPKLEGDLEKAAKDMDDAYARLKTY
ncbi:MAG TPA: hypothetical protein VGK74_08665 [Symbiobacteriaceae bacterium]|jgi:hypothetical protein